LERLTHAQISMGRASPFHGIVFAAFLLIPLMGALGPDHPDRPTSSMPTAQAQTETHDQTQSPPHHEMTKAQRVVMTLIGVLFFGSFIAFFFFAIFKQWEAPSSARDRRSMP
jgi:cytochrome b561